MNQPQEKLGMTPREYLEFEKISEIRHEYFDGEIFAMKGGSLNHNQINGNIFGELRNKLNNSVCRPFASDMRVKVNELEKYCYPDIVVTGLDIEIEKIKGVETLLNPIVILEVLSDATEAYDRGDKFSHYRLISSLKEYILVSQKRHLLEKFVRNDDDSWNMSSYEDAGQVVVIESINCELMISDIYYRVEFEKQRSFREQKQKG